MTFVSYSRPGADVQGAAAQVWRLLHAVRRGFYIDAATMQERPGSLTAALHERGWSGITFEPRVEQARALALLRPSDATLPFLPALPGGRPGGALQRTLGEVLDTLLPAVIHFLAIGEAVASEGALAALALDRHRPWTILLAEREPDEAARRLLRAHGYRPAAGEAAAPDGRLYLAEECDGLADPDRLPAAPASAADASAADAMDAARLVARAQAERDALRERLHAVEHAQSRERARLQAALEREAHAHARLREAVSRGPGAVPLTLAAHEAHELLTARHRLDLARDAVERAQAWLAAITTSQSWRITRPLRRGIARLRREAAHGEVPGDLAARLASALSAEIAFTPPAAEPLAFLPPPVAAGRQAGLASVHQFHSGSAIGDAITNAMLLTRRLLRGMGYHSEIFTERPPAALAGELRPFEELPRHGDYVLILRHSMGYDRFDAVRRLPARKVLLYHNITPPEFLARHPHLAHYARLGREQLARLRDEVQAVLADSEYSAAELRARGFASATACTLLFDVEALLARARAAAGDRRPPRDPFTILFVGRIVEAKGQLALLEAYALFRARLGRPSRLVLVGRDEGARDDYARLLRSRIAELGLGDEVSLAGSVDEASLHTHFAQASLYVSLSRHEGFGVPLIEAMAHDVPVLAWPAGAVPYTLAGSGRLLADRSPEAVASAMLELAVDEAARGRQIAAQRHGLERYRLDAQRAILSHALAAAGARPPREPGLRARLAENLRFTVAGHVNGSYSLALVNRTMASALDRARPGRVRLLAVEGSPTPDLSGVPASEMAQLAPLAQRPAHATAPEIILSQHYPIWVPPADGGLRVAVLFWEESLLPRATIALLNENFDAVLAPSGFVRDALLNSGLAIPVRCAALPMRLAPYQALRARLAPGAGPVRRFLHVSSCFPRKGVDVLLRAWARAFRAGDAVHLTIKGFPNPHNDVAARLAALRLSDPALASVTLVDRDLDDDALLGLYEAADVMVLPTRGEGLNLPAAEAMAAGLPLIVTGVGGHMAFCATGGVARPGVRLLACRPAPSRSHLASPHSLWLEPDEDDLVAALREAAAPKGAPGAAPVRPALPDAARGAAAFAEACEGLALDLLLHRAGRRLRISWVSSWAVRCGVSEYSRQLLLAQQLSSRADEGASVRVLCDRRTPPDEENADRFWPCWELGSEQAPLQLAQAIAADDADAVMIQHQPGLLDFASLAGLLRHPALAGRVVALTLHNTRHLEELPRDERTRVIEACRCVDLLVVHTLADLRRLRDLGLEEHVRILPHGVADGLPDVVPPAPLVADRHAPLIGCYGFFLPGKGIDVLIEALALLRRRWPQARLLLVNAEYGDPVSTAEITRCRRLADALGVAAQVTFETGFLPNQDSLQRLSSCDVAALPYRPSKEASSAALRSVLTTGVPVAVTPIDLFDEAADAVFRFADLSAAAIADGLDRLLADAALRGALQARGRAWVADRQWPDVALRLEGMLTGLVRTRELDRPPGEHPPREQPPREQPSGLRDVG